MSDETNLDHDGRVRFGAEDGDGDGEGLAEIVRRAGPRPTLPTDTARRLRAATESAIRRERERQRARRRTRAWLAAAAVLALLVVGRLAWLPGDAQAATVARVEHAVGAPGTPGQSVSVGEVLATGPGELLALRTVSGHSLRVAPETRFRFSAERTIALERGALYLDSGDDVHATAIGIDTRFGHVEELGTRYLVRVDGESLAVRVRDGRVALDRETERHLVDAGSGLDVDGSGTVVRVAVAPFGDAWGWVIDAAPTPEIDGRPLAVLLDWVVRETGWTLEYASDALARDAPGIVVHGSVEGLEPTAALDAILPTCGLTYEVESGTLTVGAAPDA